MRSQATSAFRSVAMSWALAWTALLLGHSAAPRSAAAAQIFITPAGSTEQGGRPVSAMASFTIATDTIVLVVQNNQADPSDVAQNISDLSFTINGGQNSGAILLDAGYERTVASDGTFVDSTSAVPTGWTLSTSGSGLELSALAGGGTLHTIIGPSGSGGTYDAADSTIVGNAQNNPFLGGGPGLGAVDFILAVSGVTELSTITSVTFSFGATPGNDVVGQAIPEPASLTSLVIGLAILGALRPRSLAGRPRRDRAVRDRP